MVRVEFFLDKDSTNKILHRETLQASINPNPIDHKSHKGIFTNLFDRTTFVLVNRGIPARNY